MKILECHNHRVVYSVNIWCIFPKSDSI